MASDCTKTVSTWGKLARKKGGDELNAKGVAAVPKQAEVHAVAGRELA